MKDKRLELRTSASDIHTLTIAKQNLEQATGRKLNSSKTILAAVKMAADNKIDLFFCNRSGIKDIDTNITAGQRLLQGLADELLKAVPDLQIGIENIQSWFGTDGRTLLVTNEGALKNFIVTSLFEKQRGKYPGLQFTRENVITPDLSEVFEAASKLISVPLVQWKEVGIYWGAYLINEGKVNVISAQVEAVKDQFRCYAVSPEERRKLAKVRELCGNLNSFMKGETFEPSRLNIPNFLHYDPEAARFEPSEGFIKYNLK